MIFSAISGGTASAATLQISNQSQAIALAATSTPAGENSDYVKAYVADYFSDLPVMQNIAWCESRDRQFDEDGNVFRGAVNNQDVGVMQINEHYHESDAASENYNIYSLAGNVAYARKLYEKFGTAPWNSSKPCWGNMSTDGSSDQEISLNTH